MAANYPPPPELDLSSQPTLAKLFELNEQLSGLLRYFWTTTELTTAMGDLAPSQRVMMFFIAKAHKTHRATIILSRAGYGGDAMMLMRSLFEMAVEARYITEDPLSPIALRWLHFDYIERSKFYHIVKNDPEFAEYHQALEADAELGKTIEDGAKKAEQLWQFSKYRPHWSGMSLAKIAEQVGFKYHYKTVYKLSSTIVHSSVRAANQYLVPLESGAPKVNIDPNDDRVNIVLAYAFASFYCVSACWCKVIRPPKKLDTLLKAHWDEFQSYAKDNLGVEQGELRPFAG